MRVGGTAIGLPVLLGLLAVAFGQEPAWFKKGSGTVVRSTLRAVPATVPDPFLNHAQKPDSRPLPALTPDQEAQTIAFIKQHHGELVDLVTKLKKTNQKQYEQAIGELAKTSKTLAETEKRDPRRYELDLKAWQTQSRVQVLAARMSMEKTPELEAELRAELREQVAIRLMQQELERERLSARIEKLDASIARLKATKDEEADKAFDRIAKGLPAGRKQTKPSSGQAGKPNNRSKEAKAQ